MTIEFLLNFDRDRKQWLSKFTTEPLSPQPLRSKSSQNLGKKQIASTSYSQSSSSSEEEKESVSGTSPENYGKFPLPTAGLSFSQRTSQVRRATSSLASLPLHSEYSIPPINLAPMASGSSESGSPLSPSSPLVSPLSPSSSKKPRRRVTESGDRRDRTGISKREAPSTITELQ